MDASEALQERAHAVAMELAHMAMTVMLERVDGPSTARPKGDPADWVTDADEEIEARIQQRLSQEFPDHLVIGEESGASGNAKAQYVWYIDPIDGTCNYAHRLRWSSSSLALMRDGAPVVGVLAHPYANEVFHARKGCGARLNDTVLKRGEAVDWPGSVVMMELANHAFWPGMRECLRWMEEHWVTARIIGSSALAMAQVAAGRAQGVALGGASPIDIGAAVLIAEEAGFSVRGRRTTASGFPEGGVVAAHPERVNELWRAAFAAK